MQDRALFLEYAKAANEDKPELALFLYGIAAVSKNHTVRYGAAGMGFTIFALSGVLSLTA